MEMHYLFLVTVHCHVCVRVCVCVCVYVCVGALSLVVYPLQPPPPYYTPDFDTLPHKISSYNLF